MAGLLARMKLLVCVPTIQLMFVFISNVGAFTLRVTVRDGIKVCWYQIEQCFGAKSESVRLIAESKQLQHSGISSTEKKMKL